MPNFLIQPDQVIYNCSARELEAACGRQSVTKWLDLYKPWLSQVAGLRLRLSVTQRTVTNKERAQLYAVTFVKNKFKVVKQ